ncbi:cap-specific mRNA (nucleoside-2'-O-)-methyltransferase 2 isoform X2 [Phymastichus coffea]|uniref:cap-specific mRNA (nucleoside-2'-O-)-methyltransferase 2 isoform X2 n=1 Tax=Phymastichus coffea TaxID=108790 RepID=UPI00273CED3F|nr:cap-specific mRNA (nucleoside-2'-O-)-methyltransferase 2 isoform X2 [Phymastichus coffea]
MFDMLICQAWCKFHEIVSKYPLVPKEVIFDNNNVFTSLHLCEAPGAFITCLNNWLKTNLPSVFWNWLAMTFNPYYEGNSNNTMISDDRFIMHTLQNWYFGSDNTGNLMSLENLDALIARAKSMENIFLITADGSVNCSINPGEQEGIVASLHFCEVVAAINILQTGGNFLLKIFTIFEHQSICLIYLLSCIFKKIHFYKPVTSKEGNSEIYVICLNYKGIDFILPYLPILREQYGKSNSIAMFKKNDLPKSFIEQIINCAQMFKNYQCEVIESNIAAYHPNNLNSSLSIEDKKIAKLVSDKFITNFPLQRLHNDLHIVGNIRLKRMKNNHWVVEAPTESYNEIQKMQILEPMERLMLHVKHFKSLEPAIKTFYFKPTNVSLDVCINIGKPYSRTKSSRFCSVQVSEIFNLIFQTIDLESGKHLSLPCDESMSLYETRLEQSNMYKILRFHYTDVYDSNTTMIRFKEILTNLQIDDNLFILGFLLLTQFHIGLIYILAHTFESVEFNINEELGCILHFKSFKNRALVLKTFQEIFETQQQTASSKEKVILSVISIMELYSSELYPIIGKLNNWIAKYCINQIASIYKNSQK